MLAVSVAVVLSFPSPIQERSWAVGALQEVRAARTQQAEYLTEDVKWMTKACGFDQKTARRLSVAAKGVLAKKGDACEVELKRILEEEPQLITLHQVLRAFRNKKIPLLSELRTSRDLSDSHWPKMLKNVLTDLQLSQLYDARARKLVTEIVNDLSAAGLESRQKKTLEADLLKWAKSLEILLPRLLHGEPWKQAPEKIIRKHLSEAQLKEVRLQDPMFVNGKELHHGKLTFSVQEPLKIEGVIRTQLRFDPEFLIASCICLHNGQRVTAQSAKVVTKVTADGVEYVCRMPPTRAPTTIPSRLVVGTVVDGCSVDLVSWPVGFAEPAASKK